MSKEFLYVQGMGQFYAFLEKIYGYRRDKGGTTGYILVIVSFKIVNVLLERFVLMKINEKKILSKVSGENVEKNVDIR